MCRAIVQKLLPVYIACCTVCKIVNKMCRAIVRKLLPVYIRFQSGDALKEVVEDFKDKLGVP